MRPEDAVLNRGRRPPSSSVLCPVLKVQSSPVLRAAGDTRRALLRQGAREYPMLEWPAVEGGGRALPQYRVSPDSSS